MTSSRPETLAARRVVSLDPRFAGATHVAVDAGRILAIGTADDAAAWGHPVDRRFADCVIAPGFVEAHGHLVAGGIWDHVYVGAHDRVDPDGRLFAGLDSNDAVIARLAGEATPGTAVIGWGFDPLFIAGERLGRGDLDRFDSARPVVVLHSNMHLMTVNTAALELVGYDRDSDVPGIVRADNGELTGELREFAAMFPLMRRLKIDFADMGNSPRAFERYARLAVRAGVTTVSDLINDLSDDTVAMLHRLTAEASSPVRLMAALNALGGAPGVVRDRAKVLAAASTDRLQLGAVKVMTDGSIQGFTAQLKPPGYHSGTPDPMWNIAPAQLVELADVLHAAGLQMHIHTNGDLAIEVALDALERTVHAHPWRDHRHVLQHFQMASDDHIRRLAAIGGGANLFANHVHHFGDQHREVTLGPARAARINPCASALAAGLPIAIHSDTPVTPMDPLRTADTAVRRLTASGRVLGAPECIMPAQAFHAITLGAAWTLKMEHEIGSIAPGKRADFCVLDADPLHPGNGNLADIAVIGTFMDGRFHAA